MPLGIPLPKVVADVGPGGGIVTAMRGINALTTENLENSIKGIEAKYAPLTVQADAASKLSYANLMGPQFLSKLMGNDSILANLPDAQKISALNMLYRAGTGQGTGANLPNQSLLQNKLVKTQPNIGSSNALQPGLSLQDQQGINNLQPGGSYVVQGNTPPTDISLPSSSDKKNSFAENVANFKGIVQEGEESGKIRAKDIKDLNDKVFNGQTTQTTLDNLTNILRSPEFEQIRQIPLAGHHELSFYSKFGNKEQQNMVGQYYTLTGDIIRNSARDFQGQFRKGEQQLLQGMKPTPSDTVDTARGKLEQLSIMNKMLVERSRLTSEIMSKHHINKLQAQEIADKQINGDSIRQQIHEKLNPTITIRNKKTGETKTISISEARKLGVPNV